MQLKHELVTDHQPLPTFPFFQILPPPPSLPPPLPLPSKQFCFERSFRVFLACCLLLLIHFSLVVEGIGLFGEKSRLYFAFSHAKLMQNGRGLVLAL